MVTDETRGDGAMMIDFSKVQGCHQSHACRLSFCGKPRTRSVYSLYDSRTGDMFYVGSAFDVPLRFREHLRDHPYVQAMLSRGHFPLCFVLLECTTLCDRYSRQVEREVARLLRKQGHSAFGDDTTCTFTTDHWFYVMVEEQAHQRSV